MVAIKYSYILKTLLKILGDNALKLFFVFFILYLLLLFPIQLSLFNIVNSNKFKAFINSMNSLDPNAGADKLTDQIIAITQNNAIMLDTIFLLVLLFILFKISSKFLLNIYSYVVVDGELKNNLFLNTFKVLFNYRLIASYFIILILSLAALGVIFIALYISLLLPIFFIITFLGLLFLFASVDYIRFIVYLTAFNSYKKKQNLLSDMKVNFKKIKFNNYLSFFNKKLIIYLIFSFLISSLFLVIPYIGLVTKLTFDSLIVITINIIYIKNYEFYNIIGELHEKYSEQ